MVFSSRISGSRVHSTPFLEWCAVYVPCSSRKLSLKEILLHIPCDVRAAFTCVAQPFCKWELPWALRDYENSAREKRRRRRWQAAYDATGKRPKNVIRKWNLLLVRIHIDFFFVTSLVVFGKLTYGFGRKKHRENVIKWSFFFRVRSWQIITITERNVGNKCCDEGGIAQRRYRPLHLLFQHKRNYARRRKIMYTLNSFDSLSDEIKLAWHF